MTVEEPGIISYCLIGATEINGVDCIWIKTYMYPKVPPVGYVALVGVPILLELICCNSRSNHG